MKSHVRSVAPFAALLTLTLLPAAAGAQVSDWETAESCVLTKDTGDLTVVRVDRNRTTGVEFAGGGDTPFAAAYRWPAYGDDADWYRDGENVMHDGHEYREAIGTRLVFDPADVLQLESYDGTPVVRRWSRNEQPYPDIWLLMNASCEFQRYELVESDGDEG